MAQENRILIRKTPKITPTLIEYSDFESDLAKKADKQLYNGKVSTFAQRSGLMEPVVMIGKVKLAKNQLRSISIKQDGLVPSVSLTFVDNAYLFTTRGYPISNILVSVFIQSPIKKLKSLASDFLITTVSSIAIPNSTSVLYTVGGELHIPKLYGNYSKSYANMTSLETLQKVAEELQLGFADNQSEGTNDTMTWIMPQYTYKEFITQVSKFAYRDDSNFFDCFIDRYYVMNFINVEKQFSRDEEIDTGYMSFDQSVLNKQRVDPENDDPDVIEVPIILTNYPELRDSEFFITDFSLVSNHGEIIKNHAIRKYLYWYEHGSADSEKAGNDGGEKSANLTDPPFRKHYLEPLISTINNDGKLPQTAELPEYLGDGETANSEPVVSTNVWSGLDYGNAHSAYKFAELLNHHNWLETEKNILVATLPGLSVNITRGSRVKVEIFLDKYSATRANTLANDQVTPVELNDIELGIPAIDNKAQAMVMDKSLSDFYYVRSVAYDFANGKYTTTVTLSRRHWLLPLAKNEIIA